MSGLERAVQALERSVARTVERVTPFRAVVTDLDAGLVEIRRVESLTPDTRKLARVMGFALANDDVVLCAQINGEPIVIGKVQISAPSSYSLDAPLIAPSMNTPVVTANAQSNSDTASTTDTVNYVDAMTLAVTLPTGTWTVRAVGGMRAKHSAGQAVRMAVEINGTEGTARSVNTASGSWEPITDNGVVTGITGDGSINVILKYRSTDAGTSSSNNPWLLIIATRTS